MLRSLKTLYTSKNLLLHLLISRYHSKYYCFYSIYSKHIKITVPYHVHTVHHHHVEKYPVYKKIEVPVVKEVKGLQKIDNKIVEFKLISLFSFHFLQFLIVPFPVHYPVKVP